MIFFLSSFCLCFLYSQFLLYFFSFSLIPWDTFQDCIYISFRVYLSSFFYRVFFVYVIYFSTSTLKVDFDYFLNLVSRFKSLKVRPFSLNMYSVMIKYNGNLPYFCAMGVYSTLFWMSTEESSLIRSVHCWVNVEVWRFSLTVGFCEMSTLL